MYLVFCAMLGFGVGCDASVVYIVGLWLGGRVLISRCSVVCVHCVFVRALFAVCNCSTIGFMFFFDSV